MKNLLTSIFIFLSVLCIGIIISCNNENLEADLIFEVQINSSNGGSVNTSGGSYPIDTQIQITATPDDGFEFTGWLGNASGNENPLTYTVVGNADITANFEELVTTYSLTLSSTQGGTVNNVNEVYPENSSIQIVAVPNEGYQFDYWTSNGNIISNESAFDYVLKSNSVLLANFSQICDSQKIVDLFNFFNSLKEIEIGDVYEFSFGNYYKTLEGNSTPIEGTFEGINYKQMNFNEINKLNAIGNEISFYFREDTGDILFIIALSSYLENGVRKYSNIRRFYAPDYPSDGDLNYEHSSYCEQWDAAENFTNDLPKNLYTYIPDDNFEQALIDLGYDDELDDYVLNSNIIQINRLNIYEKNVSDATGIEGFTSLTDLNLTRNSIPSIDVSNNLSLEALYLGGNSISSIDLSNNTSLLSLGIEFNSLTQLDVSNNSKLTYLSAGVNLLTDIDLTNNPKLKTLRLGGDLAFAGNNNSNRNILNYVDLTQQTELTYIDLKFVELKSINLSDQNNLIGISIGNNPDLTSIDLSNNTNLRWLNLYNSKFSTLDLSNQSNLGYLSIRANQTLQTIDISNNNNVVIFDALGSSLNCVQVSQYQLDNQISSASIEGISSEFLINFDEGSGQIFNEIDWEIPSSAVYSLDCN